jgi:hypothetical protein
MQKTALKLQKLDFNSTKDLIDVGVVMLANQDKAPSIDQLKKQLSSTATNLLIKYATLGMIQSEAEKIKEVVDNNSQFKNGLYTLIANDKVVGIFGLKIDKVENGKISHCSLSSFILPANSYQEKLLMRGVGSEATKIYYKDVLLTNTQEFNPKATFEVQFMKKNPYSLAFQKSLGLDKVTKIESIDKDLSVAKGQITGFIESAKSFINKMNSPKL